MWLRGTVNSLIPQSSDDGYPFPISSDVSQISVRTDWWGAYFGDLGFGDVGVFDGIQNGQADIAGHGGIDQRLLPVLSIRKQQCVNLLELWTT